MANSPNNSKSSIRILLKKINKKIIDLIIVIIMTVVLSYIVLNRLSPVTLEFKSAIIILSFILNALLLATANRNELTKDKDEYCELLKRDINKLLEENLNLTDSLKKYNSITTIQKEKEEIILEKIKLMEERYESLKKSYENIYNSHNTISDLHKEEVQLLIKITAAPTDEIRKSCMDEYEAFVNRADEVYKDLQSNIITTHST